MPHLYKVIHIFERTKLPWKGENDCEGTVVSVFMLVGSLFPLFVEQSPPRNVYVLHLHECD